MARPPRIEYDGAWYHVVNRGARRWDVFHDRNDRKYFLNLLGEIRDLWNVEIHGYSLMDNHYHLLVHTPNSNLSKAMRHVGGQYTFYYNKKYRKDGPLFKGRFKSILAERDSYLLALIRYIHMNPVKAGLCKTPSNHGWTSHKAYLDPRQKPEWLVVSDVLSEFGRTYSKARRRLHEFVLSQESPDLIKAIEGAKPVSVLGSHGFKDWIKSNFLDKTAKEKIIPTVRSNRRPNLSPYKILNYVSSVYYLKKSEILKCHGQNKNEARSMYLYLLRRINGSTHAEIAQKIGAPSVGAVSQCLRRFNRDRSKDSILDEKTTAYACDLLSHVQS